ncbi:alpha-mannosidase [Fimicolochytrium jonesii]|uniref:alpha-mannosidase n=1 Tax=Fimicolochytrium jonesii TaxID=1396493 RepID=UPI0022FECC9C|nr:alpha-mannosidase [Fimicolochytrium jonesii]KAI8819640.1 alpha-mannosidase [Fimicolochytrium jonesii]
MTRARQLELRDQTKEMFDHAYGNYMKYAFPADELRPLSCTPRYRDADALNWSENDVLGNFSLTLVDALDTHVIMNDRAKWEEAVALTIKHVHFDLDSRVQVFEVTIRMLGGLLSAHILATDSDTGFRIPWYKGELLELARDLANRLLPAFNTATGLPWPRVHLQKGVLKKESDTTCAAGAGTLVLEFGVLSRLTGDPIYEKLARKALFRVWELRSSLNLVGNAIGATTGKWKDPTGGIGAGIDSFYEYLFKAYILFNEAEYNDVFQAAYAAVKRHIRDLGGLFYKNVNIHNGALAASWIDSLAAFFPGLQVLAGDIEDAAKLHQVYATIWKRFGAMPERFNMNSRQTEIGSYPLRPEFIESTYMLYRATKDPYYLDVGERLLRDLNNRTRVPCGFASVWDVNDGKLDDRLESFFLSETLKYLYLLFDEDNFVHQTMGNGVFTTEGHWITLPYELLRPAKFQKDRPKNLSAQQLCPRFDGDIAVTISTMTTSGPMAVSPADLQKIDQLVGVGDYAVGLEKLVGTLGATTQEISKCDERLITFDRIEPPNFTGKPEAQLRKTWKGFAVDHLAGLRFHIAASDGQAFQVLRINDIELREGETLTVVKTGMSFLEPDAASKPFPPPPPLSPMAALAIKEKGVVNVAIAEYGPALWPNEHVTGQMISLSTTKIPEGCDPYTPVEADRVRGKILLVQRGGCTFSEKTEWAQFAGAIALVVVNDQEHTFLNMAYSETSTGDLALVDNVSIPSVMVSGAHGAYLREELQKAPEGLLDAQLIGVDIDFEGATKRSDINLQYAGHSIKNVIVVETWDVFDPERKQRIRQGLKGVSLGYPGAGMRCLIESARVAEVCCA